MTEKLTNIAVLTGDLVKSSKLGSQKIERAMEALSICARTQEHWMGAPLNFTRNRGDGWQVVLARPDMALRSCLAFRAALRIQGSEFDSYIAGFEGKAGHYGADLNDATGEAFVVSGQLLDELKGEDSPSRFWFPSRARHATFVLAEHISRSWSPAQASAVLPLLDPTKITTYTSVAKSLGKSRQAVTKALDAAGFIPLQTAMIHMEIHSGD